MSQKSNFTLSFIGINDNASTEAAYITWTPTKFRISRSDSSSLEKLILSQEQIKDVVAEFPKDIDLSKLAIPTILFYDDNVLGTKSKESCEIQFEIGESNKDIFVGGKFQAEKLFNGASPEDLDIKIKAIKDEIEITSIKTMIRVRKNANLLSKNAKVAYLHALSTVNKTDSEGRGIGIYSTDFFKMHVKGSKSIAHGTEVFLPWHRLYLLDLERQLQNVDPKVSLHYWKFDEPAPNIFKADFLGKSIIDRVENPVMTNGVSTNFAQFNADNPLKYWSIDREKLIRRMSWFDNQKEQAGFYDSDQQSFYPVQKESETYNNKKYLFKQIKDKNGNLSTDDKSFTILEGDPHGYTHVSNNGFVNYVPTAPKDPIFFFLHSNVERMWGKWQTMHKLFDPSSEENYPNQNEKTTIPSWKFVGAKLWPWNGKVTPNEYHYEAPGTRSNNFTKSNCYKNFEDNSPIIKDALDPFGIIDYTNYLGFEYDDTAAFLNSYSPKTEKNSNKLIQTLKTSGLRILHKEQDVQDLIDVMEQLVNRNSGTNQNSNKLFASTNKAPELRTVLNTLTLNKIFSSEIPKLSATINNTLEKLLAVAGPIEEVDAILIPLVYADNRDIIHQLELNFKELENDITYSVSIRYYDNSTDNYQTKAFSKYLVIYLLALYDYEFIQDDKIYDLITKNKAIIFQKIGEDEYLDLLITLLGFASNKTINKIFLTSIESSEFLGNLETKLKNTKNKKTANKLWALQTLFNNAIKA